MLNKIAQLKKVSEIEQIVVTSDSDIMLHMAEKEGIIVHKRAPEFCDESIKTFGEVVKHIAENVKGEHILWATCTSPLVFPIHYQEAIRLYRGIFGKGYDSLVSFEKIKRYLWNEEGPLNYELGLKHVPSQELPDLYIVTDGIILAPRTKMIEWSYFHGRNPYRFIVDKRTAIDIDDRLDLAAARAWLDMDESVSHIESFSKGSI